MSNTAIILAGGTGSRMKSELPKQFLPLDNGTEIIIMTINAFACHEEIDRILIVCQSNYVENMNLLLAKHGYKIPISVIDGGDTRQHSALLGLKSLKNICADDDIILIHDAARPFVTDRIISDNIAAAKKNSACTTVIPVQDSLLYSDNGSTADSMPNRSKMYNVQTPQTFRYSLILDAHEKAISSNEFTDDAGILLSQGIPVSLVIGDKQNFKITTAEDLSIANSLCNK